VWRTVGLSADWDESHRSIVDALKAGDVDTAVNLTKGQIEEAAERMLPQLAPSSLHAKADV
jgi:DNA-binding GntR family transcriptional regulator